VECMAVAYHYETLSCYLVNVVILDHWMHEKRGIKQSKITRSVKVQLRREYAEHLIC